MNYSVLTIEGKPSEYFFTSEEELRAWVKNAFNKNKFNEDFDFKVYNDLGDDISETLFVTELVEEETQ
jgi:hypothetical protein